MSGPLWTAFRFRISLIFVNLIVLLTILTYHSYRLCYLQRDLKGSPLRILRCISFRHLSFIVIIASILPALQQAITYTPQHFIPQEICRLTTIFGIVSCSIAKLALHLFVTMRSQIALITNATNVNIWYKIGLLMTLSDILYIIFVLSGIPTIISAQDGVLCRTVNISLSVYIWFAMNDFVIGFYCLLAFILPLRKYVWLEQQQDNISISESIETKPDSELRSITTRVMVYSSIALLSTMVFTVISSIVNESGGVLFAIDTMINSLCVTMQFSNRSQRSCCSSLKLGTVSEIEPQTMQDTPRTVNAVEMVIHPEITTDIQSVSNMPQLNKNVSLSISLI